VIVRFGVQLPADEGDALTVRTIERLQRDGVIFAGGARWRDVQAMRISVTNYQTDETQAHAAARAIVDAYRTVRAENEERADDVK
jgi:hypothetical protein